MNMVIASPCIRHCTLDENDICIGCFRHIEEITGWQQRDDSEKAEVLASCEKRRAAHFLVFSRKPQHK